MRSITIAGREYPLRFTLRVVKACTERYGSLEGLFDTTQQKDGLQALDESLWLLEAMLDGGRRYNEANGLEAPVPPDQETLLDVLDLVEMQTAIHSAMAGDSARTVEADPPKNAGDGEAEAL